MQIASIGCVSKKQFGVPKQSKHACCPVTRLPVYYFIHLHIFFVWLCVHSFFHQSGSFFWEVWIPYVFEAFFFDPCCNLQKLRQQCCATRCKKDLFGKTWGVHWGLGQPWVSRRLARPTKPYGNPLVSWRCIFWVISFTKNAKNAKAKSLNVIEKPVLASLDGAVSGLQMVVARVKLRLWCSNHVPSKMTQDDPSASKWIITWLKNHQNHQKSTKLILQYFWTVTCTFHSSFLLNHYASSSNLHKNQDSIGKNRFLRKKTHVSWFYHRISLISIFFKVFPWFFHEKLPWSVTPRGSAQSLAQCRHARGAGFVKAALSAGLAWQRRLREPSGTQIGWKQLALQEMLFGG